MVREALFYFLETEKLVVEDSEHARIAIKLKNAVDLKHHANLTGQRTNRIIRIGQSKADTSQDLMFKHHMTKASKELEKGGHLW